MRHMTAPRTLVAAFILLLLAAMWTRALANPFDEQVRPIEIGDRLPGTPFIDQDGHRFTFADLEGKGVVVGFIFTHCKDECPLITQRFAQLNRLLAPGSYGLVEVTIDPQRDTPAVIADYAREHDIRGRWRFVTGSPQAVAEFVREAGISVIADPTGDLIHNAKLLIIDPDGRLADTVETIGWNPPDVAAQAEHDSGAASSWFGRLDFALTGAIAALCGGSYQTASGILDLLAAALVIIAGFVALAWLRRRIFAQGG